MSTNTYVVSSVNQPTLIGGQVQQGALIQNSDNVNTIWIRESPDVAPNNGFKLTPQSSITWGAQGPAYACLDQNTAPVKIIVSNSVAGSAPVMNNSGALNPLPTIFEAPVIGLQYVAPCLGYAFAFIIMSCAGATGPSDSWQVQLAYGTTPLAHVRTLTLQSTGSPSGYSCLCIIGLARNTSEITFSYTGTQPLDAIVCLLEAGDAFEFPFIGFANPVDPALPTSLIGNTEMVFEGGVSANIMVLIDDLTTKGSLAIGRIGVTPQIVTLADTAVDFITPSANVFAGKRQAMIETTALASGSQSNTVGTLQWLPGSVTTPSVSIIAYIVVHLVSAELGY